MKSSSLEELSFLEGEGCDEENDDVVMSAPPTTTSRPLTGSFPPSTSPSTSDEAKVSSDLLRDAQRNDEALRPIIEYLSHPDPVDPAISASVKEASADFYLHDGNGLLFHKRPLKAGPVFRGDNQLFPRQSALLHRVVIPNAMRAALLKEFHEGVCGAHLGQARTYERLANRFYWDGMYQDVKQYVASCQKCLHRKTVHLHREVPLGVRARPSQPFEALGIDVLGPLPLTARRMQFILVITDYFTRWPFAFAMRNQRASTIATILVERVF
jgi:hypothetical protein